MTIKGWPDQKKTGEQQYATVAPLGPDQNALDVLANMFHQKVGTDTAETGSTATVIKATGHAARRGDAISFTSGGNDTLEVRVLSVETDYITVASELDAAPANGDAFTIWRPKVPKVDNDGEQTVGVTFSNDTDYGVVGGDTLRTAAQVGNATGAADFGEGTVSAQTLRVSLATDDDAVAYLAAIETDVNTLAGAVAGTEMQVDVVSSALPTGAATAANQATEIASLAAIEVDVNTLAGAVAGTEMQVDIVAALPAGTNNIGDVDVTNLPTTVDTNSGAAGDSTLRSVLATRHEAVATPLAVQLSTGSAAIDYNAGAASAATPRVAVAATNIAYTAKGKIAGSSLTGTYAALLNPTSDLRILAIFNTCNNTILISLDGGTTDSLELEAGESITLDLAGNGLKFDNAVNISAKHAGAAPTSGSVRASGIG